MSHRYEIKRAKYMADDLLDESKDESDENLDDELDDESNDESGDDHTESETSEDDDDQSEDDESDDSSSKDETADDENDEDKSDKDESEDDHQPQSKRTPEQIAKYERKRRKKAERELRNMRNGRGGASPSLPPGGLADRVWQSVVKVDIQELAQTDPTVIKRTPLIKKIIFDEMPELQKNPNGVKIANDIAKGRMIKITPETEPDESHQRTTPPSQPRQPQSKTKFRILTEQEVSKLSEQGLRAYEDALAKHYADKK
jgi:hypothetical protein